MSTPSPSHSQPRELIERTLKSSHPRTVAELAHLVVDRSAVSEDVFTETLEAMAEDESIILKEPAYSVKSSLDYLFTPILSAWLWLTLAVTAVAVAAIILVPDVFPLVVIRWVLGSIFVVYLQGYALMQFLFPISSEVAGAHRFALSVGTSLVAVLLTGLILNYMPWGIRLIPIVASLAAFTILVSIGAGLRNYWRMRTYGP